VLGNSFQNRIEIFSRLVTFEFTGSFAEFPDLRFSAMPDHQPRLVALIDEAGCHGESYDRGSSHFLSMGAAVTAICETDNVLGTFNEARAEREHTKPFKKFISNNDKDNFVLTKLLVHFGDIVASAFHRAIDPKKHGMTDDRFARNLIPTIYSRSGRPYGLKIFPPAAIDKLQKIGQLGFLKMFK
jgi:hypothetical protein